MGAVTCLLDVKGPCHVICLYLILESGTSAPTSMNIAQQMHYGFELNVKGVCKRKGQPLWFMTHSMHG